MATRHVLKVSPETVQWGVWDANLAPVLRVESGDLVEIHTISGEPEDLPAGNSSRCTPGADAGRARIS
jgi:acetamidase/formamidase